MITVLVADDHTLVRNGVCRLLEDSDDIKVIAVASNGKEAICEYKSNLPDVTLLDVSMPVMDGLETCISIKSSFPEAKILILSVYPEEAYAARFLLAGALGYATKMTSPQELQKAVRLVAQNRIYISDIAREAVMNQVLCSKQSRDSAINSLSPRETAVFNSLVHGKTVKEIASDLSLSVRTVENYRYRIFEKLGIHKTTDLVSFAYRHHLI